MVEERGMPVTSSGWADIKVASAHEGEATCLIQEYYRDKQDLVWATEDITVTDDGDYIAESIRRGKAVTLSDG